MIQSKLLPEQLTDVITLVFKGSLFKILRIIKEAGRSRVVWVYLIDGYGNRRATFVSVREMNIAFLRYLDRINRTLLKSKEQFALSDAFALILKVGDMVSKVGKNEFGIVLENNGNLFVDWGNGLPLPEFPLLLEIF
jgi:hypothetical protein